MDGQEVGPVLVPETSEQMPSVLHDLLAEAASLNEQLAIAHHFAAKGYITLSAYEALRRELLSEAS